MKIKDLWRRCPLLMTLQSTKFNTEILGALFVYARCVPVTKVHIGGAVIALLLIVTKWQVYFVLMRSL